MVLVRSWRTSTAILALAAATACAPLPPPEALEPLPTTSPATSTTVLEAEAVVVAPPTSSTTSLPGGRREDLAAVTGMAGGGLGPRSIRGSIRTGIDTRNGSPGLTFTGWADGAADTSLVSVDLDSALEALRNDPTLSPTSKAEAQLLLGAPFEVLSMGPVTWLRWPGLHRGPDDEAGWVETNAQRAEAFTAELGFGSSVVRPLWLLDVLSPASVRIEEVSGADGDGADGDDSQGGRHLRLTVDLVAALADVPSTERIAVLSEVGPGDVLTLEVWLDDGGQLRRFGYERYDDGDLGTPPTGAGTAVVVDLVEATDMPALTPPSGAVPIDEVLFQPAPPQGAEPVD